MEEQMNTRAVRYCALLAQTLILATGAIAATTYVVQPDSTGDFATIQLAINASANGDTVALGNGVFTGDGNRDIDFLGKVIVVCSQSGNADSCIIDCEGSSGTPHRGFWFHSGEDTAAVLANVTVRGGAGVTQGGGCLIGDPAGNAPASPRILGCQFEGNQADEGAGLAIFNRLSLPRIEGCYFAYNEGSGICIAGNADGCSVTDCTSEQNKGDGIRTDGAWTGCGGHLDFTRCTLRGNAGAGLGHHSGCGNARLVDCKIADNDGWGIESFSETDYGVAIAGGSVTGNGAGGVNTSRSYWDSVIGCVISDNHGHGLLTWWDVSLVVRDCEITDNDGHGIAGGGSRADDRYPECDGCGGVQISRCTISRNGHWGISHTSGVPFGGVITDCVILANGNGGVRFAAQRETPQSHLTLASSTIALNLGNGFEYQTDDVPGDVENCILSGNTGAAILVSGVAVPTLSCCDLFGNGGGDWVGAVAPQLGANGNFSGDPLFCSVELPDLGLLPASPCAPANNMECGLVGALPVGCEPMPDLVVERCDQDTEDAGQPGVLMVTVRNQGYAVAGPSKTTIQADGVMDVDEVDTPSIEAGQAVELRGGISLRLPKGAHEMRVCADATGLVGELTEGNNCKTEVLDVQRATGVENWVQPGVTELVSVVPNPFAGVTKIRYTLREAGRARLEVFDSVGRRVRMLRDAWSPQSMQEADWDGRDERGMQATSGIYYLRFTAGGQAWSRAIVLLR
jgi:hypothetical protein